MPDRWVVMTCSGRPGYPWFATLPVLRLNPDATDAELTAAIRDALLHSRCDDSPPADRDAHRRRILTAAGVTSWAQLERGSRMCDIRCDDAGMHLLPSRNETRSDRGPTRGFAHLPDRQITLPPDAADEAMLQALRDALNACE